MSLLGIDIGTTGCKAAVFSLDGKLQSLRYTEYDIERPRPHQAELDSAAVWEKILSVVRHAVEESRSSGLVQAVSVTSMGENVVPVSKDRQVLGASILNVDQRGAEYVDRLRNALPDSELYAINGNVWGNQYSLPKLMWLREYEPRLYEKTYKFLHWGSFVLFMLGGQPVIDYSLANRSLLFDIRSGDWSDQLLKLGDIEREKLPTAVRSGDPAGTVSRAAAEQTGLAPGTPLFAGAHDQCANALGCGVVEDGMAMYGMGTFPTIAPVFSGVTNKEVMIANALNTEHHAVPGKYLSFLFHMGGSTVKWFRQTLAQDLDYDSLFRELPETVAPLLVLPRFAPMGPPDYEADPCAVVEGLSLESTRGDLLKGILEANTMALNVLVEKLPEAGIYVDRFFAVGGGSRSDSTVQIASDILGKPLVQSDVSEAGALGAALLAGIGVGAYRDFSDAAQATARQGKIFNPDTDRHRQYTEVFALYKELRSTLQPLTEKWIAMRKDIEQSEG
ncbi:MAG: FGGY-family carbohydrate kinase [Alkalispirochaeta sp.]